VSIRLYDLLGRSVGEYEATEGVNSIDLSRLAPGLYSVFAEYDDAKKLLRGIRELVQEEKDRLGIAPGQMPIETVPFEGK